jgi:hypothetical protein
MRERARMKIQEIDTLQQLKIWVGENMAGATVEEGDGGIVIRTNLISTMGGYLYERESVKCKDCSKNTEYHSENVYEARCLDCREGE